MPRYSVSGAVHGSTWIGEYDANDAWQAIEFARNDADVSLCHECARSVSDPEVCELTAEDLETGDATSEATTNDQIVEQAAEIRRLRAALDAVMDACDPECYGCGAYYVAKKALDGTKEKP
jgi:hypothetical protein